MTKNLKLTSSHKHTDTQNRQNYPSGIYKQKNKKKILIQLHENDKLNSIIYEIVNIQEYI